jgi:SAM-dependent methyltransferase
MPNPDEANKEIWARDVELFGIEGWADRGELVAMRYTADLARGVPALDIGVGAGRTAPLMRLITADYRAIDYTPEMVELCRRRHPEIKVSVGDARDLADFADEQFGLVAFSNNGLDAVDHEGRELALANIHRVLRPDGIFFYSALNKDSALFAAQPGTAPDVTWHPGSLLPRAIDEPLTGRAPDAEAWTRAIVNWRRLRKAIEDHGDWGISPFAAHEFGLLTHFITLDGARSELTRHGFELLAAYACEDGALITGESSSTTMYMHLVAQKPA